MNIKTSLYKILKSSERYTKTDMIYLTKGGFWLTFVQVVGTISAFILSVLFARLFPKEAYGTYKYIIALSAIIGTFTLTGLGPAITQSVARGFDGALKKGFMAALKWGSIIVLISFVMAAYYAAHHNFLLAYSLVLIGITSPLIDAGSFFGSYLNGKKDFKLLSLLNALGSVFPALCLGITLFITTNLVAMITVYFVSYTVVIYFSYLYTIHRYSPHGVEDPGMMTYGKHLTFLGLLNTIADQADKVIVYHYVGAIQLAVYTFATALPMQVRGVLKGISPLTMPKFASRPVEEIRNELWSKTLRFLSVNVLLTLLYIVAAPFLFHFFFPQYIDAIFPSQIFALTIPAMIAQLPSTLLQAKKHIKTLYRANTIFAIIKLSALFLGVYLYGFWGVIMARVAYEYIGVGLMFYLAMNSND